MIRKLDQDQLSAEIAALEALLSALPATDYLGRLGFESRRDELRTRLAQLQGREDHQARVILSFAGRPVVGSEGVEVGFASNAIGSFQDLITKVWSRDRGELAAAGPVRDKMASQLHVTNLVHGSFGFLLEELDTRGEPLFESPLKQAADQVADLISSFAAEDERQFLSIIEGLTPRVFLSVREFLRCVHREEATFRLVEGGRDRQFNHPDIERAWQRAEESTLDEERLTFNGQLLGIIPIRRRFEFQSDERGIIEGKVGDEFSHSYLERMSTEQFAGRRWRAIVYRRLITRVGRPAAEFLTLLSLEELDREAQNLEPGPEPA
jgi:hypothetical protein